MQTRIAADTLDLSGLDISYRELNSSSGKVGKVTFLQTRGRFTHITNLPEKLKNDSWCRAKVNTLLMGQGRLLLIVNFNLTDSLCTYNIQGDLGPMSAIAINPVAMPLGLTRIKSGQINSMNFSIKGNRYRNNGTMHTNYQNISVEVLQPDYGQKVLKTVLVNTFVIKHNNPDEPEKPARFAKIVFLRPKSYPFFKTIWNTLFNGFKSCAGVGPAVQPEPHESLTKKVSKVVSKLFKRAVKKKAKVDQSASESH